MTKTPAWCLEHIAELGQKIIDDEMTAPDAAADMAQRILKKDQDLAGAILADWSRNQMRRWVYQKMRDSFEAEERSAAGQDMLPFPDLPPKLEVRPGVDMHQNVMTGKDWDNALAIWRNRRDQAQVSFERFKRRYDQIRPLLEGDLTTADVADKLA